VPERVSAVLGAVREPISKKTALQLACVDLSTIDEETLVQVEAVFDDLRLDKSVLHGGGEGYFLNQEARKELARHVDVLSVKRLIATVHLRQVFPKK
jgi:hypothetical protein